MMNGFSARQCTLTKSIEFSGFGVHSGLPSTLKIEPAAIDSGLRISSIRADGTKTNPVDINYLRISNTTLCTTLDLGDSVNVATIEHVLAALSGIGVDNALITIDGCECPILDGSAALFAEGIIEAGLEIQPQKRKFIKILRAVKVRKNQEFATLEPYNGRVIDVEIDFDNSVIGRQRMIFDWTPRLFVQEIARARTFGFIKDAKILQQGGHALGSSMENSIAVGEDTILNKEGLRYEDEFVRHKLLDAIGDLALGGLPIYGRFRSYKGGHKLNSQVLKSMFANEANYEVVTADKLPLPFDALDDLPLGLKADRFLHSVV